MEMWVIPQHLKSKPIWGSATINYVTKEEAQNVPRDLCPFRVSVLPPQGQLVLGTGCCRSHVNIQGVEKGVSVWHLGIISNWQ